MEIEKQLALQEKNSGAPNRQAGQEVTGANRPGTGRDVGSAVKQQRARVVAIQAATASTRMDVVALGK